MKSKANLQILITLMFSLVAVLASTPSDDGSFSIFGWLGEQFGNFIYGVTSFIAQIFGKSTFFDCEFKCENLSRYNNKEF